MPIYEFECHGCGHRFDVLLGVVQEAPAEGCPACKDMDVRKLISQISFHPESNFSDWNPSEQRLALENKAEIEANRSKLLSGEWELSSKRRVPLEIRPDV